MLSTRDGRYEAEQVVVATGGYQSPRIPPFASGLSHRTLQLHSSGYRNPSQLREGSVLVVGAGNSGAEIALEVSSGHHTWLSGRDTGQEPVRAGSWSDRLATPPFWFVLSHVLTVGNPLGRKVRHDLSRRGLPLARVRRADLAAAGARAGVAGDRRAGWPAGPRGRQGTRSRQRHLVHRLRSGLHLDRPSRPSTSRATPSTIVASSPPRPGSTSWDCSSSTQGRPRWWGVLVGTRPTSPPTSSVIGEPDAQGGSAEVAEFTRVGPWAFPATPLPPSWRPPTCSRWTPTAPSSTRPSRRWTARAAGSACPAPPSTPSAAASRGTSAPSRPRPAPWP